MGRVAYARGAYKRVDLPELRLVNQYVEASPANPGDNAVLLPRPGLVTSTTLAVGPVRGMLSQPGFFAGDLFAVAGGTLYRGSMSVGPVDGQSRVSMAAADGPTLGASLLIGNDAGLYLGTGSTVAPVAFPDGAGASSVGYIAGYSFAVRKGSRRIYYTLDPTIWDGGDYFSAEQDTGPIVHAVIVSDQLWVFCPRVTEVFSTTGDAGAPFLRVEGRVYDKGCLARDTVVKGDNTVFWVGNDRIVYRGDSAPIRVSNHGIEERLAASQPEDLSAWLFVWNGHSFYVLRTAQGTFAFDAATQEWCEFASHGRTNWRAWIGIFRDGKMLAGDDETGRIWSFSDAALTDDGAPIEDRFTALISGESAFMADNIVADVSMGYAPDYDDAPVIEMRQSRDGGRTWADWRAASLGRKGEYRSRAEWRRCGLVDSLTVLDFRTTDQVRQRRLSGIRMNDGLAGRSR